MTLAKALPLLPCTRGHSRPSTAVATMPRPAWDSTIHDLSVHRISRSEAEARRKSLTSPNAMAAKATLERRRAILSRGSFESTIAALSHQSGEESSALRELDEVEHELHRLADDGASSLQERREEANAINKALAERHEQALAAFAAARPITDRADSPHHIDLASIDAGAVDECATPPTPAFLHGGAPHDAPWAGAAEPSHDAVHVHADGRPVAPVVDLDHEIELFRQRTGERLTAFGEEMEPSFVSAAPQANHPPSLLAHPAAPVASAEPTAAQRAAITTANARRESAGSSVTGGAAASANKPPWRPAMGHHRAPLTHTPSLRLEQAARPPSAPPLAGSARAPDALGLARMQHACTELTGLVDSYEAAREGGAAAEGAEGSRRHSAGAKSIGGGAQVASFGQCNAQLAELTKRLVAHLARADEELSEQTTLRASSEAALSECRARLDQQADVQEAETAALRREVRLLKEHHGAQLATLTSQLATLQTARNTSLLTSMAASLQQAAPPAPPPAAPLVHAAAGEKKTRLVPSLFTMTAVEAATEAEALTPATAASDDDATDITDDLEPPPPVPAPLSSKLAAPVSLTVPRPLPGKRAAELADEPHSRLGASPLDSDPPAEAAEDMEGGGADDEERREHPPLAWAERNVRLLESASPPAKVTTRSREPRLSGAMPASAMPAVVKCSIGPPQRVAASVASTASETPPSVKHAPPRAVNGIIKAPASHTSSTATSIADPPSCVAHASGDEPGWLDLGPADVDTLPNDERSQVVLQAYYDEIARAASAHPHKGATAPKAPTASHATGSGNRRGHVGRVGRASMEPTKLFAADMFVPDAPMA